jgi:hypothetical protein
MARNRRADALPFLDRNIDTPNHYGISGVAMFEIVILSIILLAVGYWATLWTMGRREDVLHGQFVQIEAQAEPANEPGAAPPPAKPVANAESLQSLLASIKRELKDAARR